MLDIRQEIRSRADIVTLMQEYLPGLRKTGRNWKTNCPFHKERTPSFTVNPEGKFFHCFGCQTGGDIITFVTKIENISFHQAIEKLAKRLNIPQTQFWLPPEIQSARAELTRLYEIYELVTDFYHNLLCDSADALPIRQYLAHRKINDQMIRNFRLGYAPEQGDKIVRLLNPRIDNQDDLLKTGLVTKSDATGTVYDLFRGRIIFPITDIQKRVLGFGARTLNPEIETQWKYINSPETPIFSKRTVFYGLAQAIPQIRSLHKIIIVEGYLDVIALHQVGISHTVATLGTALTEEHINLLTQCTDEVCLMYDADEGGDRATLRSFDLLAGRINRIKIVQLPEKTDPDELALQSPEQHKIQELIDHSQDGWYYCLSRLISLHKGTTRDGKIRVVKEILPTVRKITNLVLQKEIIREIAYKLNVDEQAILLELRKLKIGKETEAEEETTNIILSPEEELVSIMLQYPKMIKYIAERIQPEDFSNDGYVQLIRHLFKYIQSDTLPVIDELVDMFNHKQQDITWITKLSVYERNYRDLTRTVEGLTSAIRSKSRRSRWQYLSHQITAMVNGELPFDELIWSEYETITKQLKGTPSVALSRRPG